ncbi:MAG: HAD family phosphatase [Clostridia bacterium]|nr:HAD family phosphatase [Clostridia bacterium]
MDYRLIALDLDDTLLDSSKRISRRNREAIDAVRIKGAHVVIATGRAYGALTQFRDTLGLHDYSIHIGGALISDPDGRLIYGDYIAPESVRSIMEWAVKRGIYFQVYTDRDYRYLQRTVHTENYERNVEFAGIEDPDLLTREDLRAAKILLIDTEKTVPEFRRELSPQYPDLSFETSMPWFLEISNRSASKGNALRYIGRHLGIPAEQTAAFGDSEIDLSMIEYAGLGAAMANAAPEIRAAADVVVPSNTDDGVAWGLEKYCLHADRQND